MTPPAYTLRPAAEADYDFLYQLHVATIRPAVEAIWGWDDALQEEYFRARWDPSERQIVVVAGKAVGPITLKPSPAEIFLGLIEIQPDYQGRGLGTALIRQVMAEARNRCLPLKLHVLKANPRARQLYQRLGFEITEEREERYVTAAPAPC